MPKSSTKPEDTFVVFHSDEPLKLAAKKFGVKPSTLRGWWVSEFGELRLNERAKKQHRRYALNAAKSRIKPTKDGLRECTRCLDFKEHLDFPKRGSLSWCLKCRRSYHRSYTKTWKRPNLEERKQLVSSLKDRPCTDCGIRYPHYVMDFDHVTGDKHANVSAMKFMTLGKLLTEISKCEVVCSNCHRIRTYLRGQHSSKAAE